MPAVPVQLTFRRIGTRTRYPDGSRSTSAPGSIRTRTRGPTASPSRTISPSTTARRRSGATRIEFTIGNGARSGAGDSAERGVPAVPIRSAVAEIRGASALFVDGGGGAGAGVATRGGVPVSVGRAGSDTRSCRPVVAAGVEVSGGAPVTATRGVVSPADRAAVPRCGAVAPGTEVCVDLAVAPRDPVRVAPAGGDPVKKRASAQAP